jgi:galactokinase
VAEEVLDGDGACRVHGGGFAGTTLNFVPDHQVRDFTGRMDAIFGEGACLVLDVRAEGAARIGTP